VLGLEARTEVGHGRCAAFVLQVALRVLALVDKMLEPLGLGPRLGAAPVRGIANGVGALAHAAADSIAQDEGPGASGGDTNGEAFHFVVVGKLVALVGDGKSLNSGVGEMCHGPHALTVPTPLMARRVLTYAHAVSTLQ
jgi:hypothetical protein